jgi:putative ABC transport system permease protein
MALGAGGGSLLGLVLARGLLLSIAGVGTGVIGALALTLYMESLLFGIGSTDPATYFAVSTFLLATALVAAYIPTRRALRVDPIETLRVN